MKRPGTVRLLVLALAVGLTVVPGGAESASATEAYADQVISDVRTSTPTEAPGGTETPIQINTDNGEYTGESADMTFAIPDGAADQLTLESSGDAPLTVTLPDVQVSEAVLNTESDAVVFPENGNDTAVAIQAFDEGAQLSTVLNSTNSPASFAYEVSVPTGGALTLLEEGGVAVTDADGAPVGFISTPWARDGAGAEVPTRYSVSGNVVTQFVDHRGKGFQYPIVADPYLFKDLISSARWDWIERSPGGAIGAGWTLRVTPTKWARGWGAATTGGGLSYYIGTLGWKELYKKYKDHGLTVNLDSMRDQWICHQQFVSVRRPGADTWNLDEWRADRSYAMTVRYMCNPPRGGNYVYN